MCRPAAGVIAVALALGCAGAAAAQFTGSVLSRLDGFRRPASVPAARKPAVEDSDRLMEILVELAWLSDPATFPYILEAHVENAVLHVRGFVPHAAVREQALALARLHCPLKVTDELIERPQTVMRPARVAALQVQKNALAFLTAAPPFSTYYFQAQCDNAGKLLLTGYVHSFEEKLAVSQKMRRLPGCACVINMVQVTVDIAPPPIQRTPPQSITADIGLRVGPAVSTTVPAPRPAPAPLPESSPQDENPAYVVGTWKRWQSPAGKTTMGLQTTTTTPSRIPITTAPAPVLVPVTSYPSTASFPSAVGNNVSMQQTTMISSPYGAVEDVVTNPESVFPSTSGSIKLVSPAAPPAYPVVGQDLVTSPVRAFLPRWGSSKRTQPTVQAAYPVVGQELVTIPPPAVPPAWGGTKQTQPTVQVAYPVIDQEVVTNPGPILPTTWGGTKQTQPTVQVAYPVIDQEVVTNPGPTIPATMPVVSKQDAVVTPPLSGSTATPYGSIQSPVLMPSSPTGRPPSGALAGSAPATPYGAVQRSAIVPAKSPWPSFSSLFAKGASPYGAVQTSLMFPLNALRPRSLNKNSNATEQPGMTHGVIYVAEADVNDAAAPHMVTVDIPEELAEPADAPPERSALHQAAAAVPAAEPVDLASTLSLTITRSCGLGAGTVRVVLKADHGMDVFLSAASAANEADAATLADRILNLPELLPYHVDLHVELK